MSEEFHHIFQLGADETPYRLLASDHVGLDTFRGKRVVVVDRAALSLIARTGFDDISHLLRPGHLAQLRAILEDPEASSNDRFVALELLKNANIAAGRTLPMCQDTGTAIILGHKGEQIWTGLDDEAALSDGIRGSYTQGNLRYSQMAPLTLYDEANTGSNLPGQIDIYAEPGDEYHFLFMAKGGGSANKTFLYQETRATLTPKTLAKFFEDRVVTLGTSACPPYHLSIVIGGLSAEQNLKTVKLASARYLDRLPTTGDRSGRAFRDLDFEQEVLGITRRLGIGAQFGGKYFCHDVRVIRLPRHGASLPIGIGVSCSADRQALGKITADGVWLEQLETDPARFLPEVESGELGGETVRIDLNQPMEKVRDTLSQCGIGTRLSLSGALIVARDIAHAKWRDAVEQGKELPDYTRQYPIYYAGPAKTPTGMASGSFGPTTAGRMDSYADFLMSRGASLVTLAKGNRSSVVKEACQKFGGFYLGSIGGAAARLAQDAIRKVEVLDYPELGMEAVWRIEVEDFPAFVITDDKGHDFFSGIKH